MGEVRLFERTFFWCFVLLRFTIDLQIEVISLRFFQCSDFIEMRVRGEPRVQGDDQGDFHKDSNLKRFEVPWGLESEAFRLWPGHRKVALLSFVRG